MKLKHRTIACLKKELDNAATIDIQGLANQIQAERFACKGCAQCCRPEHGDNTVSVLPFEIQRICEHMHLPWNEIAVPAPSEDRDAKGNIHTFEWVLRKRGECIFLRGNVCQIYEHRPYLCKTYPFYLQEGRLMVCECEGIGEDMRLQESLELAALLKERYLTEIQETIALIERFRGFNPDGEGALCVHDSSGEHWIEGELLDTGNL